MNVTAAKARLASLVQRPPAPPAPDFASALVEQLVDGVVACDAHGNFTMLNRKVREAADGLTPVTLPVHVPKEDWAEHFQLYPPGGSELLATEDLPLVRALAGETVRNMVLETRFSENGGRAVLNVSAGPVVGPEGQIQGAVVMIQDITERAAIDEAMALGSAVAANIAIGVSMVRAADGVIAYSNEQWEQMFGYGPGELIGRHISVVNAPTTVSPEERAREIFGALEHGGVWGGEFHNVRKDGTRFWTYANISRFEHPDHGTVWITASTDITDWKADDSALHNAAERFRMVFEDAPIGMALVSTDLQLIDVNRRLCEIVGWRRGELIGRPASTIVHRDDHDADEELSARVFNGEIPRYRVAKRYVDRTGNVVPVGVTSTVLREPDGRPLCWITAVEDARFI
jgi:PAS domain S-box-containing protein